MNIFLLDLDPKVSARYLCNEHVCKMIVESAQMLSTAHRLLSDYTDGLYKPAHINHPSTIWTRESIDNYRWHYEYFCFMAEEYEERYGKTHMTYLLLQSRLSLPPERIIKKERTPIPLCMPDKYKQDDPVQAYRSFYIGEKLKFAHWSLPSKVPSWIISTIRSNHAEE
jgi:Pyrimidine dimer DNA glycosylase